MPSHLKMFRKRFIHQSVKRSLSLKLISWSMVRSMKGFIHYGVIDNLIINGRLEIVFKSSFQLPFIIIHILASKIKILFIIIGIIENVTWFIFFKSQSSGVSFLLLVLFSLLLVACAIVFIFAKIERSNRPLILMWPAFISFIMPTRVRFIFGTITSKNVFFVTWLNTNRYKNNRY